MGTTMKENGTLGYLMGKALHYSRIVQNILDVSYKAKEVGSE